MLRYPLLIIMAMAPAILSACGDDDGTPNGTGGVPNQTGTAGALAVEGMVTLIAADAEDAAAGIATGDFNGDGNTDVLLAAAFADGPENSRMDAGEVLVFLGPFEEGEIRDASEGGADAVVYGAEESNQAGRAIAATDVNGDGIDDIVAGVPFGSGPENDRMGAGETAVVFGSSELGGTRTEIDLANEYDVLVYGASSGATSGFSLATGELNGDEFGDVIIGSFRGDVPGGPEMAGFVEVIYGGASLPREIDLEQRDADVTVYGPSEGSWLGESVAAGDFNGDGLDDLLLSATFAPTLAGEDAGGRVFVLISPLAAETNLASEQANYVIYGEDSGDQLGHSSATGDVDGDGLDDILLGAVSSSGAENAVDLAGEAALIFGSSLSPEIDVAADGQDAIVYGRAEAGRLGRSVALGDVDEDGSADMIFGVPGTDAASPLRADAGALYVVAGSGDVPERIDLAHGMVYFGEEAGDQLTNAIEGRPPLTTADVNRDGRSEILVSTSGGGAEGSGAAYILFVQAR